MNCHLFVGIQKLNLIYINIIVHVLYQALSVHVERLKKHITSFSLVLSMLLLGMNSLINFLDLTKFIFWTHVLYFRETTLSAWMIINTFFQLFKFILKVLADLNIYHKSGYFFWITFCLFISDLFILFNLAYM